MKIDMSPQAVTTRLRRASQLRRLCVALGKARPVGSGRSQEVVEASIRPDLNHGERSADGPESG